MAKGLATILSLSSSERYLFREDGVYRVPGDTVATVPGLDCVGERVLVLYDLNVDQPIIQSFSSWPYIIASSPQIRISRYDRWEKERGKLNARFVMNPWDWPDIYAIR